jgi:hypothetical protein
LGWAETSAVPNDRPRTTIVVAAITVAIEKRRRIRFLQELS